LYAAEILFETAKHFPELDFIDFGSGFKVPYKKGDIETRLCRIFCNWNNPWFAIFL